MRAKAPVYETATVPVARPMNDLSTLYGIVAKPKLHLYGNSRVGFSGGVADTVMGDATMASDLLAPASVIGVRTETETVVRRRKSIYNARLDS